MKSDRTKVKRREFLKIGAAGTGIIVGKSTEKSHASGKGTTMSEKKTVKNICLDPIQNKILTNGYNELLSMTEGLTYKKMPSERYPYPLTQFTYSEIPDPERIRNEIKNTMNSDPVALLEKACALLELYESNHSGVDKIIPDDRKFLSDCFNSKRMNGWIAVLGNTDRDNLESAVNGRWQFRFFNEKSTSTGLYAMLNILVRYASVYGRTNYSEGHGHEHFMDKQCPGEALDAHDMTHFIDEHCPGLLVCSGKLTDLELLLSLMAMKIGVPAIVPTDYPFPLGKTIRVDSNDAIVENVVMFPNIRRLLDVSEIPHLPSYCQSANRNEKFKPYTVWGNTPDSFYILHKGTVEATGFNVTGKPEGPIGIVVTVDAEPMDAFDCKYIENAAIKKLSMIKGVSVSYNGNGLTVNLKKNSRLKPLQIGEVLVAAVRHDFPKLEKVYAEIFFDSEKLTEMAEKVKIEKERRETEMDLASEETIDTFYSCVGCSPFAPNHMCVLTPERTPQCGRPYEMIKTGALYSYDDMSNIHHSIQHRNINSFQVLDKGTCLDPIRGEWSGANEQIRKLTHGKTRRVLLHTLKDNPHTGCGCFRLVIFEMNSPVKGIGIMDRSYKLACPDGRTWKDIHYELGGKQAPGVAGASPAYLTSPKFLQADGGWKNVVWVSPNIAKSMGDRLPASVIVGSEIEL